MASNAIYPISIMPGWLHVLSQGDPLTYKVDALRVLMVIGGITTYGLVIDIMVLLATTAAMVIVATHLYARVIV